jgi:hypothetical protein
VKIDDETTCSATELGLLLDLTPRRIRQLAEEGTFERVGRGRYPLAACVQAYIATIQGDDEPEDLQHARLELIKTQRRKLEQQIRDRQAFGHDLDWQDAVIRAITFEAQMRIRMIATWLHVELLPRNMKMDRSIDALAECCYLIRGWASGIRRDLDEAFLGAARLARRKQVHLDHWEKVVEYAQLAAELGDTVGEADDDPRHGEARSGNGRDAAD